MSLRGEENIEVWRRALLARRHSSHGQPYASKNETLVVTWRPVGRGDNLRQNNKGGIAVIQEQN